MWALNLHNLTGIDSSSFESGITLSGFHSEVVVFRQFGKVLRGEVTELRKFKLRSVCNKLLRN